VIEVKYYKLGRGGGTKISRRPLKGEKKRGRRRKRKGGGKVRRNI